MKFTAAQFVLGLLGLGVAAKQPNILFILTDDQGKEAIGGLEHMPELQEKLVKKGSTYPKHFCSVALCCPSRANLWTGRMPHNTNVTNVEPPYGGYPRVVSAGWNDNYLPLWMQDAGYDTYYVGKLWNSHTEKNYNKPYPRGFNGSDLLLDPWTYRYHAARMTRNAEPPVDYSGQYSTDVIRKKALGFLDDALKSEDGRPWMLTVAPNAPHSNGSFDPSTKAAWFGEPEYPDRHANLFKDYRIPRDKSFNRAIQDGPAWVGQLEPIKPHVLDYIDEFQRCRLRALQSVDEMIGALIDRLEEAGELDNTYIFYSTDNGYHAGQHAMQPGKNCGYETDINVPLIVRGPGIPAGETLDVITSHTDLAPTFLKLAGAKKDGLDGIAIPTTVKASKAADKNEHVAVEYWGTAVPEGIYGWMSNESSRAGNSYRDNTYKAVRLLSDDYSLYYSVWCTGEVEFYDLKADPQQTQNLGAKPDQHKFLSRPLEQAMHRLNTLTMVLKSCNGDSCRHPWQQLHPGGQVKSLSAALDARFDKFYAAQPKVTFADCALGYIWEKEGPHDFNIFGGGKSSVTNYSGE
ncbi:Arylsulphatase [Aspergillus taichungensis]|uniref:Arylsulfatase n=1 Tax=Aspergillus taichungensis TaxID=482145 RepID=A0A2J5I5R1_9EURO|nr:Arylsulphatase [Aspergillus taichungensis]